MWSFLLLAASSDLVIWTETLPEDLTEMSGLQRATKVKMGFWSHNDSGDSARIFALDSKGAGVGPANGIELKGAKNVDWEDIAGDGKNLWISDLGNNGNKRQDLGVYVLPEPDPLKVKTVSNWKFLPISYPDQKAFPPEHFNFDSEAIFMWRGKLHVLTKQRLNKTPLPKDGTVCYRLDTQFTDKKNVLTRLDSLGDLGGWVTAADISPDGKKLAILCHAPLSSVWILDLTDPKKPLSGASRQYKFTGGKQCEAIAWWGDGAVMIGNEQRQIFKLAVR